MKRTLRSYSLLALLLILLGSCGKKSNVPVPENAGMVIHINGASLNSKLSWDEFKQGELYRMAKEEIKDDLAQMILDNPDSSGVDIRSDAWFFIANTGANSYAGFTCNLKDDKAFGRVIQKIMPLKEITKQGDLSVMKMGSDGVLTWSSNRLVMTGEAEGLNSNPYTGGGSRSSLTQDSLLKLARDIYDIKGSNSISSNSKFASMLKEEGDAHFWVNSGGMYGGSLAQVLTMLPKLGTLIQGNFTAATINFANGKITMSTKGYFNKELKELYAKYSFKNLDESTLKKIPAGDVDAVIAANYPPEALQGVLSLIGVDGLANAYLSQLNYSIEEFVKGNKGDMILAVSDFKFAPQEVSYPMGNGSMTTTVTKPEVKVLFATSVKEKASWDKLMTILHEKVASEGGAAAQAMINKVPYMLSNDWFVAGSDSSYVHAFGTASTDHPFISKISGHPMGAYIDIQKFINGARPSFNTDSTANLVADESAKMWQDIVFYGGDKDGDSYTSYGEINLVDKNTNSLKQLHNYFGRIAAIMKEQKDKRRAAWENTPLPMDSMKIEMPPVSK